LAVVTAAVAALAGVIVLGSQLSVDCPTRVDFRVRRIARGHRRLRRALAPLFPLGLPVTYLTAAHVAERWMRARGLRGGSEIVASAWAGWISHALATRMRPRLRPPPGQARRRRADSYPSGHTTGATALAGAMARVLSRRGVIGERTALLIGAGVPLAMGLYRVVDDEHWLTDVAGGWMLGGAAALACTARRD
jgi:membrane-associated phospholipid phosphatase